MFNNNLLSAIKLNHFAYFVRQSVSNIILLLWVTVFRRSMVLVQWQHAEDMAW